MPEIDEHSRLKYATWHQADETEGSVGFWSLPPINETGTADDDLLYRVVGTDRIDGLAYRRLRKSILWDVIAELNGFRDLPTDMQPNQILRLPSEIRVLMETRA